MSPSPSNPTVRKWGGWGSTSYDGRNLAIRYNEAPGIQRLVVVEAADITEFIKTIQDLVRVEPPEHVCAPVVVCRCPTCGDDSFPLPDDADYPTDLEQRVGELERWRATVDHNILLAFERIRRLKEDR